MTPTAPPVAPDRESDRAPAAAPRSRRTLLAYHLGALLLATLLSVVVTFPLVLQWGAVAMGEDYPDRVQNMWNLWWVKVALLDQQTSPFHTTLLFWPHGADLYYHTLNLPSTLLTLLPQLLFGVVAAYNTSVLLALVLSGYAGFRLVYYLTRHYPAALLGGMIIAFNPLALFGTRSQINLVSLQWFLLCIEFYLRAWEVGRRRDGILAGLFFTLALLTVGYYEVHLLVFFAVHLGWVLATAPEAGPRARLAAVGRRLRSVLTWAGGTALLLAGPYALAAWLSLQRGVGAYSDVDVERTLLNSADAVSLLLPYRGGWLLGQDAPWWAWVNPKIHDHTDLGLVALALALGGVWAGRRGRATWLWVAVGAAGAGLALGPVLQVNGQRTLAGLAVPLPFALLQAIPPFNLVRFPERALTLTYCALGVLAAGGVRALLTRTNLTPIPSSAGERAPFLPSPARGGGGREVRRTVAILGVVAALLLLDWPLYPRSGQPLALPASLAPLRADPVPGALVELPLTQHDWVDSIRMGYQIGHGRPITSGYLSRTGPDPFDDACSPFRVFTLYPDVQATDIVSPTAVTVLPALLQSYGAGFLAVYKTRPVTSQRMDPLDPQQLAGLQALAARLGTPLADDATATTYRLPPGPGLAAPLVQLGPDWYGLEKSGGKPFRWIDGAAADLCVFRPVGATAPLQFQVTSFAVPRHLQVFLDNRLVFSTLVPADGQLHAVSTPPLAWPAGRQRVRLLVPEGSAPAGTARDGRQISLGFGPLRLDAP